MAEYSVELNEVSKIFPSWHNREVAAVRGMTLKIRSGEFFTLLGPSGCGKTTTLRLIAGFEFPTQGEVFIQGKNVTQAPPNRRPVNTVFQSYALFPHLNVAQNVAYGLVVQRVHANERRRRTKEALEMVRLSGMEDRKPSQLSGGQQQRVALARALINRPAVLLLDEPLGALDLKLRKEMQFELKQLQTQVGITFVYVTHDQEEALTMSDRIAVMSEGQVLQVDEPLAIYETPASRFVADFIGETNFLHGQVEQVDNGVVHLRVAGERLMVWRGEMQVVENQSVSLAIRPEKFNLAAMNGSNGHSAIPGYTGEIRLNGIVETVVYLGTDTRYAIQLGEGEHVFVRIRNAGEHGLGKFAPGEKVQVWCKPEDARVLME